MTSELRPISDDERLTRLSRLRGAMGEAGLGGVLLGSTESLRYFTGLVWHASERLLGAVVTSDGVFYVVPGFEQSRVASLPHLPGEICVWQEEDSAAAVVKSLLGSGQRLAVDDGVPLFVYHALGRALGAERLADGGPIIRSLRIRKSPAEIAIIQYAMDLTLAVHREVYAILKPGIKASEVIRFIDDQHRARGAGGGSSFCIVSFGEATSLPHGADGDQIYKAGDAILVDTGCRIDGYHSDLTRSYMLDSPTRAYSRIWAIEREAQQAVFDAAVPGASCESLDDAARVILQAHGLGPDYRLPGLPHRAGHGLGLEIHEEPYIVRGNASSLGEGMCFSNEPMIVVPGQFGIRLEDHIHMTSSGAQWFTTPARGPCEPFA